MSTTVKKKKKKQPNYFWFLIFLIIMISSISITLSFTIGINIIPESILSNKMIQSMNAIINNGIIHHSIMHG